MEVSKIGPEEDEASDTSTTGNFRHPACGFYIVMIKKWVSRNFRGHPVIYTRGEDYSIMPA